MAASRVLAALMVLCMASAWAVESQGPTPDAEDAAATASGPLRMVLARRSSLRQSREVNKTPLKGEAQPLAVSAAAASVLAASGTRLSVQRRMVLKEAVFASKSAKVKSLAQAIKQRVSTGRTALKPLVDNAQQAFTTAKENAAAAQVAYQKAAEVAKPAMQKAAAAARPAATALFQAYKANADAFGKYQTKFFAEWQHKLDTRKKQSALERATPSCDKPPSPCDLTIMFRAGQTIEETLEQIPAPTSRYVEVGSHTLKYEKSRDQCVQACRMLNDPTLSEAVRPEVAKYDALGEQ